MHPHIRRFTCLTAVIFAKRLWFRKIEGFSTKIGQQLMLAGIDDHRV